MPPGFAQRAMSKRIRVLIADDHGLIVAAFTQALKEFSIEVVSAVTHAHEVAKAYAATKPDVVVLDIRFGDDEPTGLDIAAALLEGDPKARVIFCSQYDTDAFIREAYSRGALAFISKVTTPRNFAAAIEAAAAGKRYWLPEIQERMANLGVRGTDSPLSQLTAREMQVFRHMMSSLTNQEIATKMDLSLKTISVTRQSIVQKLGEERPLELMRHARKHHLIDD